MANDAAFSQSWWRPEARANTESQHSPHCTKVCTHGHAAIPCKWRCWRQHITTTTRPASCLSFAWIEPRESHGAPYGGICMMLWKFELQKGKKKYAHWFKCSQKAWLRCKYMKYIVLNFFIYLCALYLWADMQIFSVMSVTCKSTEYGYHTHH